MKTLYLVLLLFLATPLLHVNAQAPVNKLSIFLGKLQTYVETHYVQDNWKMPIARPDETVITMPSPDIVGYMEDRETGLRYYANTGKVTDPETGYSFDTKTWKIDLENKDSLEGIKQ